MLCYYAHHKSIYAVDAGKQNGSRKGVAFSNGGNKGFSLIELMCVLLIITLTGLILVTKRMGIEPDLAIETAIVKSHLRYVQHLALGNAGNNWDIKFYGGSYELFKGGSSNGIFLPDEDSAAHSFPSGLSISIQEEGGGMVNEISYDEWGSPGSRNYEVTLKDANGRETIFNITKNTGFIQ